MNNNQIVIDVELNEDGIYTSDRSSHELEWRDNLKNLIIKWANKNDIYKFKNRWIGNRNGRWIWHKERSFENA